MAVGAAAALFVWQGHVGFGLGDEGHLWYTTRLVLDGGVPVRDSQSYDPGRYYWTAAFMRFQGHTGVIALRVATAAMQALGLFAALTMLARHRPRVPAGLWPVALATLLAWMLPGHKLFDITTSILLVGAFARVVGRPSGCRWFVAGLCVGLAAFFGRNHGLYGVVAGLGVSGYLAIHNRSGILMYARAWVAGIVIGYLPQFVLFATTPGMLIVLLEDSSLLLETGATNLTLPVPWPWRISTTAAPPLSLLRDVVLGLYFVALVVFAVAGPIWAASRMARRAPLPPLVVACTFVGLPYAHHALSRADTWHLAQGLFPFLLAAFAGLTMIRASLRWPLAATLAASGLFVAVPQQPGWQCATNPCRTIMVGGDELLVAPETAGHVELLTHVASRYGREGETFLVVPAWPGAYALFHRRAPTRETYMTLLRTLEWQARQVQQVIDAKPSFVLIRDVPLDGRDDLRFRNLRPLLYDHIRTHFARVTDDAIGEPFELWVPATAAP
ncbi:MAG: hypothetical protein FJW23_03965 [Acidimicrobiia bacterium]|nr:hypothetical protein [Acidimicrobiia bacterium]